jgi:hypothetical protein
MERERETDRQRERGREGGRNGGKKMRVKSVHSYLSIKPQLSGTTN